jgi:hypothetical protein
LPTRLISAEPVTDLSVCEYQETRNPAPINPKTNKPYTPDERNQETFAGASISKNEIRQCLQAKTPIENHHIVFEDYRDAWQSLTAETRVMKHEQKYSLHGELLRLQNSMCCALDGWHATCGLFYSNFPLVSPDILLQNRAAGHLLCTLSDV